MAAISFAEFSSRRIVFWGVALVVAAGLFFSVRAVTVCWRLTALRGIPPEHCAGDQVSPLESLVLADDRKTAPSFSVMPDPLVEREIEYPSWDGASRINILFVGLRADDPAEGGCPFCTDTLILLTVDPMTRTAGMLSIPRDMWVNIPGFGNSRINTAWTLGRGSKLPGGGPALAMKTVSHFIGVPVDYYVQVDFDTFVDIINLIGGVDIYNDETVVLDPMAHGRDFPQVKLTCCGMRHLNGREALAYARCRHIEQGCKDGDIGRARRQQKVIFAIRDKVLDPRNFPGLLAQAPELYNTFSAGIHTNMALEDAIKLAVLVGEIPRESIKNRVIDQGMVTFGRVLLGGQSASVMKPIPDEIRVLRDEIFTVHGPATPLAEGPLRTLVQADRARVRLLNGTSTPDLERGTRNYLSQRGIRVTELGETRPASRTTIVLYSPKLYALQFLLDIFDVTRSAQILIDPDPTQSVDIEIQLGNDWVGTIPVDYEAPIHPAHEDLP
jgi:LCP family protein required for cell wall assembly